MKPKFIFFLFLLTATLLGQTTYAGSAFTIAANSVTTSTLNISDSGNITDVNITMSGTEACDIQYLDISLQSPYSTIVELTNISTLNGSAFSQTIFDDEASTTIANGSAPYFGSYQPVGSLASFNNEEINGDWILNVYHSQSCGSEITAWSITIVTTPPLTAFTATPTSGIFPLFVQFTDQSQEGNGTITSWEWDFGDGGTSNEQNPSNTYTTYGVYSVSLTVSDDNSLSDTLTKDGYITVDCGGCSWYVSTSGSDNNIGSIDSPFATIQAGIDATSDNDTVLVQPGTYVENINFDGKNIVVGSLFLTMQDTSYISSTIIDGNQNGSVVTFENGEDSTAMLSGLTLTGGSANQGGGIYCLSASPKLTFLNINNNTAADGGGICLVYSNSIIQDCNISYNEVTGGFCAGGGIKMSNSDNVLINRCIISHNSASGNNADGGGIYCQGSPPTTIIRNSLISFNTVLGDNNQGGGIRFNQASPTIIGCTIIENSSAEGGGILYLSFMDDNATIINSILRNNSPQEIIDSGNGVIIIHTNIQGGWAGNGNIDSDPIFIDANNDNFRLSDDSPCIGAGVDSIQIDGTWYYAPTTDIDGNLRPNPAGSNPDMGAYENQYGEPQHNSFIYVSTDGNDVGSAGFESAPFATIQAAINYSIDGDTVLVLPGTYFENILFGENNIVLKSLSGRDSTIIDGLNNGRVFEGFGLNIDTTTVIDGFTIQNGYSGLSSNGGGIVVSATSSIKLINCIIKDNTCQGSGYTGFGGGYYSNGSSSIIENCIFQGNTSNEGGAIGLRSDIATQIKNCEFFNNTASSGSSIEIINNSTGKQKIINSSFHDEDQFIEIEQAWDDSVLIINCDFSNSSGRAISNNSSNFLSIKSSTFSNITYDNTVGAAIISIGQALHIKDCKFINISNTYDGRGAVLYTDNDSIYFEENLIVDCPHPGGNAEAALIYLDGVNFMNVSSSIFWCEEINQFDKYFYDNSDISQTLDVWYSNINAQLPMGVGLIGNIYNNPFFCDPYNGDYSVAENSPVIGNGEDGINIGGVIVGCDSTNIGRLWYVSPNGSDTTGTGSYEYPFKSIQNVLDQFAINNDTLILLNGTYNEEIIVYNDNVTIASEYLFSNDQNDISSTVIDGYNEESFRTLEVYSNNANGEELKVKIVGLTIQNARYGGIVINSQDGTCEIRNTVVNNCYGGIGGGISAGDLDTLSIEYCLINENSGGVYINNVDNIYINKSTLVDNSTTNQNLKEIFIEGPSNATIENCIIWGFDNYGGINMNEAGGDPLSLNYSDVINLDSFGNIGIGNIAVDPAFVDTSQGNFNLQWGSPCINTGNPNSTLDPDGSIADMGAFFFDQTDPIPPTVAITNLSSTNIGTEDSITVIWEANDNWILDSAFVDILYVDTTIRADTVNAEVGEATIQIPDFTIETFQLIVTVWDYLHNEAIDTSEVITVFDNTLPTISVTGPANGFTIPENTKLTTTWNANDNISVDSVIVYYSNDSGYTFIEVGRFLAEEGENSFIVPEGISNNAQLKLIVEDIYDNTSEGFSDFFSVTDNTPPTIELQSPVVGTELDIGTITQITWSATDNDSLLHVNIEYNVDGSGWTLISENEYDDGEYAWLVPDNPSNDVELRVIAVDGVGLTDTATVEGLSIIVVYPTVVNVEPQPGIINWGVDQIMITFSQSMDTWTITNENVSLISSYEGVLNPVLTLGDQSTILTIDLSNGLASSDTVEVTINSNVTNTFGYGLDGNKDGVPGDGYSYSYYVQMLADYDTSYTLDVLDLATFIQALEEDDFSKELGPVTGTAPYFYCSPDSLLDIEDVMGFVMIWNWYVTTHGGLFREFDNIGNPIEVETNTDSIFFDLPAGVIAYEVQIKHDPESIIFGTVNSNGSVKIQDTNEELGIFNLINALKKETTVAIPINISDKETNVTISIRTIGFDRIVISQQTKSITIENIPDEFALHHNYPNPFNPVTTIRYDLPFETDVHLVVFDILGREVRTLVNEKQDAGFESVKWNGRNDLGQPVSAGMYFYRIRAGSFSKVQKMLLLK